MERETLVFVLDVESLHCHSWTVWNSAQHRIEGMPRWKFNLNRPKGQNVTVFESIPGPISLDSNFNLVRMVDKINYDSGSVFFSSE